MGGLFGGGTSTNTIQQNSAPWQNQQPYLQSGFDAATSNLNQAMAAGPYQGSYYSPMNGIQTGAVTGATNYAGGLGSTLMNDTGQVGQTMMGGVQPFMSTNENIAQNGAGAGNSALSGVLGNIAQNGAQPGVSGALSSALQTAGVAGANSLANGQNTLAQVQHNALSNPTQNTINAASQYANNPAIQNQINAAIQPIQQTLTEQTLPGLNQEASMGGNLNSSRAGMAEAMANRDAAIQEGNITAQMQGAAYNNGLNLSAQQQQAGMNAATNAATAASTTGNSAALGVGNLQQQQGQFNANAQLNAANAGIAAGNQTAQINTGAQLSAAGQLGGAVGNGMNAATMATNQAGGLYNLAAGAGSALQQDANNQIAANQQKYMMDNGGWANNALNNYWNIVQRQMGNTSTGSGSNTAPTNVAGGLVGLGMLAGTPIGGGSAFGSGSAAGAAYNALFGAGAGATAATAGTLGTAGVAGDAAAAAAAASAPVVSGSADGIIAGLAAAAA